MIVYLASYPRSGNFWLQSIVANHLGYLTCNIHPEVPIDLDELRERAQQYYGIEVLSTVEAAFLSDADVSPGCFFDYQASAIKHQGLRTGCGQILQEPGIRKQLAAAEEHFFVKTHLAPYLDYFDGESVVQIVRNPGAVLWSYHNFIRDLEADYDHSLMDFIRGNVGYGSWSEYHRGWQRTSDLLGDRFLTTTYESIHADEQGFHTRLSEFTGLPVLYGESKSFEYYHSLRPNLARAGQASGWEEHYTTDELTVLWNMHGEMMRVFGFGEPNYENAGQKE